MSTYRREPEALLATPRQLFEELSAKYGGLVAEERIFLSEGSPSRQEIVRPLGAFGKCHIGEPEESYRVAIRWCSAYPLDSGNGGASRIELLPRMPRTRAEYSFDFGQIKPLLTLHAIKQSAEGHEYGKKFYLKRSAQFPFGDGFSYYAYEHLCPLVAEMFLRFGELTSGFAFYLEPERQEA